MGRLETSQSAIWRANSWVAGSKWPCFLAQLARARQTSGLASGRHSLGLTGSAAGWVDDAGAGVGLVTGCCAGGADSPNGRVMFIGAGRSSNAEPAVDGAEVGVGGGCAGALARPPAGREY